MAKKARKGPGSKPVPGVAEIQSAIHEAGDQWEAGSTELTELPIEQREIRLGLHVSDEELRATASAISAATGMEALMAVSLGAPPAVDWRSHGGNFVTPIKNQASCGSCVSFATIATIESRINVSCKRPGSSPDLSEAHLFYCGCGNCCGTGWNFVPALAFCQGTGTVLESCFPYTPANQPCKRGCPIYTRIQGFATLLGMADRKNAIAGGGPVVAGMAVYQDFFAYKSGVYRHRTGALAGYHAVSVIGYDDRQGCWIAKNSWGTGWGDGGFFRIAYGQCGMDTQFAMYAPAVACPRPMPQDDCSQAVPMLRRVLAVAMSNPRLRACLRYFVCQRGGRPPCGPGELAVVGLVGQILRRCPQFRAPFCRALG